MEVEELGFKVNKGVVKVDYTIQLSNGYWNKRTRDKFGNQLSYKDSTGFWHEYTYDKFGNELTYKNSTGYWCESTRDKFGNVLSFKDCNH
jgi:YD repeat-containing protein